MLSRIKTYIDTFSKFDWKTIGNGHVFFTLLDCLKSRVIDGTNTEQFITLEFYRKSQRERNLFVTNRKTVKFEKISMRGVSKEEFDSIHNKVKFNQKYKKIIRREFLSTCEATADEITAFIKRHQKVLAQPTAETQGRGIELIEYHPDTIAEWSSKLTSAEYIVEEYIRQHSEINKVNPTSVNTIRVCSVLDNSHTAHIIGAAIRCGGKGSTVDNFHHGGVAYPIDIDNGVVCGRGKTNSDHKTYARHPATGILMVGFHIPHWDLVMKTVKEAAEMSDRIAYLGWDVAITEDGVEVIEANDGQGCTMWQLDNVGKYPEICRLLRS